MICMFSVPNKKTRTRDVMEHVTIRLAIGH